MQTDCSTELALPCNRDPVPIAHGQQQIVDGSPLLVFTAGENYRRMLIGRDVLNSIEIC